MVLYRVLEGHSQNSPIVGTQVWVGGVRHQIWGRRTGVVEHGVPLVVLLSGDSTPQVAKFYPGADRIFQAAAEGLVHQGVEFFTVLRPAWSSYTIRWMREYR